MNGHNFESGVVNCRQSLRNPQLVFGRVAQLSSSSLLAISRWARPSFEPRDASLTSDESSHAVVTMLLGAQEEERARISRELHDGIGQELALLVTKMRNAGEAARTAEEMASELSHLTVQAEKIAALVRGISHDLHPAKLQYLGLPVAVESFCREFSKAYNIEVECNSHRTSRTPESTIALAIYRILQEALQNVVRHSGARRARVELASDSRGVVLNVSDSGKGFGTDDPHLHFGLGLLSMKERAYAVRGSITIRSEPGHGTRVEVFVPTSVPL